MQASTYLINTFYSLMKRLRYQKNNRSKQDKRVILYIQQANMLIVELSTFYSL
jgi:hypothetical protein